MPVLNKKYAGVPVWAWAAMLTVGLAVAIYMRRRSASNNVDESTIPDIAGSADPLDRTPIAPGVGQETPGDLGYPPGNDSGTVITDPLPDIGDGGGPPDTIPIHIDPINIIIGNSNATPDKAKPGKGKQPTFRWGGRLWHSGQKPAFQTWLRNHGSSYQDWVKAHPKIAKDVFGDLPRHTLPIVTPKKKAKPNVGGGAPNRPHPAIHAPPKGTTHPAIPGAIGGAGSPAKPPATFSWGGKVWRKGDKAAFTSWLKSHGATYAGWAAQHPAAAAIL